MTAKTETKVYKCKSCGMVTTEKGHLCSPQEVKKPIPVRIVGSR